MQTGTVAEDDAGGRRPELTLFPDHGADLPVWHGPDSEEIGNVGAEELRALGVSPRLVERLREWQEGWEHDPFSRVGPPRQFWPGGVLAVRLARQLQAELRGHRVFLGAGPEPRPVEEWGG